MSPEALQFVKMHFGSFAAETIYRPDATVELRDHEILVAHVAITLETIEYGGVEVLVGGIGFVCVRTEFRHMGLMHAAMEIAHWNLRDKGLRFALLWTTVPEIYRSLGYFSARNLPDTWMVKDIGGTWNSGLPVKVRGTW